MRLRARILAIVAEVICPKPFEVESTTKAVLVHQEQTILFTSLLHIETMLQS